MNTNLFLAHVVDAHPKPDAEWLRVNESNRRFLSEHYGAKRSLLQRLTGKGRQDFSNWTMDPPPPQPASEKKDGLLLMEWLTERVAAGDTQYACEYLMEHQPGLSECDSFENLRATRQEFERLEPYLQPSMIQRCSYLGEANVARYPLSAPVVLSNLELANWVLYDRDEVHRLLAAVKQARRTNGLVSDRLSYSPTTWESISHLMQNKNNDFLVLMVLH